MSVWPRLFAVLTAVTLLSFQATNAEAKMLITDLAEINIEPLHERKWRIVDQQKDSLKIDCLSCDEQILVNVLLGERNTFGPLGISKARKAKSNCEAAPEGSLQCDTIEGIEMGKISGLISTVKISEGFFVGSYILGDDSTLIQIRTKAPTKESATGFTRQIYQAIKAKIIVQ
ncbi:MAG: hypothetical protein AAGA76_06835 [Pseudomonadota bacterium]